MLQYTWTNIDITTNKAANDMIALFKKIKPKIGGFDTETTGLHIIEDKPFVVQFGFIDMEKKQGYTYAVDLELYPELSRQVLTRWNKLAETLDIYLGHNIKFDLHMLANIGLEYSYENVSDTMFYIRYAHDALTPANGGPPMGLKEYASKYIDANAKAHEKLLDSEKTSITKELNLKLKTRLAKCGTPPVKYNAKSYTLAVIDKIFSDPIFSLNKLEPTVKEAYLEWLQLDVPLAIQPKVTSYMSSEIIPYNLLNRKNLIKYAHFDVVYTIEIYLKLNVILKNRHNEAGVEFENKLIYPFWQMERCGFAVDKKYLTTARQKMQTYIEEKRIELYNLLQEEVAIGQHERIKTILNDRFNITVDSTGSEALDRIHSDLLHSGENPEGCKFIELVQELRTLEKWYSVYIMRFVKNLKTQDRLYTTLNQVGTVSGRITSDFQQFPSSGINTSSGEHLFSPRNLVKPTGNNYNSIIYLDYSQIELRFQAFYTILVGHPDLNLCRAYMPYKCINTKGETFDYTNIEHIKHWKDAWYYEEDPEQHWIATDVHGATTEKATGLTPSDPDFAYARKHIGKRVNFAKNYGAQFGKIKQMFPDKTDEEIRRIDGAYYAAFPGVKEYHSYCYQRAQMTSFTENLFGIKYYGVSGHKLINMLVQGSAAFYLKWKIRQLYDYMKEKKLKSKLQMQIHDELSWEMYQGEEAEAFNFQHIMEDWDDTYVPIVADMEITTTTWAEKYEIHSLKDIK